MYNTSKIMDGTGDRKYCTELDDDTRNCLISIYDGSNDNCANVPFIY